MDNTLTKNDDAIDHAMTNLENSYQEIVQTLPKRKGWRSNYLVQYKGFWLSPESALKGVILMEKNFNSKPNDIVLVSSPKTGTTWFKALIFAIMNREIHDFSTHPLLSTSPHDCFCYLESFICEHERSVSVLDALPSPRLLATHVPYTLLPNSITKTSNSRIVYICREPKDVLVSSWIFMNKVRSKDLIPLTLEDAFELFSDGVSHFGPFWDHVLEFWKASSESPDRVLFLTYEDMKKDPIIYIKKLAEFVRKPFSQKEENEGVMQKIRKLCSFENLKNLDVNKSNATRFSEEVVVDNRNFYRKGEVGDWKNHLTEEMVKRVDQITEDKLSGSGFAFGASSFSIH